MEKSECQHNVYPNKRHHYSKIAWFGEKKKKKTNLQISFSFMLLLVATIAFTI